MNNQAAQTMPVIDDFNGDNAKLIESACALISLSDSGSLAPHGIGGHARAILSAFIVRTEAAALSQTAGVAEGGLEAFTDYFVKNYPGPDTIIYDPKWHAPRIFRAAQRAIQNAAPAASGGEDECGANFAGHKFGPHGPKGATQCEWCGEEPQPPTSASVSERAWFSKQVHDMLIDLRAAASIGRPITGDELHELEQDILRALEQALTQQRGTTTSDAGGEAVAYIESYECDGRTKQGLVWADHPANTPGHRFTPLYTAPPNPGDARLRGLANEWRERSASLSLTSYTGATLDKCADELESLLGRGGK